MNREIVSKIAYLIGVKANHLFYFEDDIIDKIKKSNDCSLIRKLTKLRTKMLSDYNELDRELKNNYGRISVLDNYNSDYEALLNKHGLDIEIYSGTAFDYIKKVNKEIEERIDTISPLFTDDTNNELWTYIRNLFIFPAQSFHIERKKFIQERSCYPFSCYINWVPQLAGNILEDDIKFRLVLYSSNGKKYEVTKEDILSNLYSFIFSCNKTVIAVDCENVNFALFYNALNQFNTDALNRIEKIILFDDPNLKSEWNYYISELPIELERIDCPRILKDKSTLDVKMTACITAAHYRDGVDGFILASSDSDYWGLIDAIGATAKFFVIYEKAKVASRNLIALNEKRIESLMLEKFYDEEQIEKIKEDTYKNEISTALSRTKLSIEYFLDILKGQTTYLTDEDKETFRKIACELKITFNEDGTANYEF